MSLQPLAFTGISSFSSDFRTILERAVSIASIPLKSLQNEQAKLLQQKQLTTNLNGAVSYLAEALAELGETGASRALTGASSNTAKVTIAGIAADSAASYTLSGITSLARAASASSTGYADGSTAAVSATGTVKLTFDGAEHTLSLTAAENNLAGLRDKINALGLDLHASLLTTGTGPAPYYLSLTSGLAGVKPIALVDDPGGAGANLLATVDNGANSEFKVNGVTVAKPTTLINDVVPGISFNLVGTTSGAETVTLTLSSDRSAIAGGLRQLASAYNQVRQFLDGQVGEAAGLLTGDYLVRATQQSLREVSGFDAGTGTLRRLADVGIEFSESGEASFNEETFNAIRDSAIPAVLDLLESGIGPLQSKFTQFSDPVTGLIKLQQTRYDESDKRISGQIETLTGRIQAMQASVSARLQAADALLGRLEAQRQVVEASYSSLNVLLFGKKEG